MNLWNGLSFSLNHVWTELWKICIKLNIHPALVYETNKLGFPLACDSKWILNNQGEWNGTVVQHGIFRAVSMTPRLLIMDQSYPSVMKLIMSYQMTTCTAFLCVGNSVCAKKNLEFLCFFFLKKFFFPFPPSPIYWCLLSGIEVWKFVEPKHG